MNPEKTKDGEEQPHELDCLEEWLCERLRERRDREDEVGRVARWVLRQNRKGEWPPGPVLLARYGHAYDVPAHYERVLRHAENFSEEDVQAFFRVYDLYLADDGAEYDRMVEERRRKLDEEFIGHSNDNGGENASTTAKDQAGASYSWESWNRFFYKLHGREGLGYDVDEDGWPIDEEYRDEGRE